MSNLIQMKRLFLLLFGAVTLVAHAQVPDYVPTEGLVAWYPFNGNANDESGISDNGELFSVETAPDRFGNDNSAFYFSGSGCTPHIETNINWLDGTEGMSISFWINRVGNGCSYPRIFGLWSGGNGPQSWGMAWGNSAALDYMGTSPANNTWHHVAVTLTSDSIHAYLNGALQNSYVSGKEPPLASYMSIGRMTHPAYDAFNGYLDDFALYNRTLTQAEITALYNAQLPIPGCTDPTACNYNEEATSDDGSCIPSGCMEAEACNYNAIAECDGEACDYTCCPGPGCCSAGMFWDYELEQCQIFETCQEDLDGDGVIGINDLMELLSSFGTMCEEPETGEFTCGDPVSYHGYDYATVQIGEQCWFAENLRTEFYQNGDSIPINLSNSEWTTTSSGARAIFANDSLNLIYHTYNGYAVTDDRKICPINWHVPTDSEWNDLEISLGMNPELSDVSGIRGTHGDGLKASASDNPSWNGSNYTGFGGFPSYGRRGSDGLFDGGKSKNWSSTNSGYDVWLRNLLENNDGVERDHDNPHNGNAVRCLKD